MGSKQLLQGMVNRAMEPERCASAVGDLEWDSTAAALHLVFLEVFLVGTTAEFYISLGPLQYGLPNSIQSSHFPLLSLPASCLPLSLFPHPLPLRRCAELILIAVSNQLDEVWMGRRPYLLFLYLRQYFPGICTFLAKRNRQARIFGDQLKAL